jgi:creatinine amidohydrolase
MRGELLDRLTWIDAAKRLSAGWPVVVPVGAAAKAHGPHLPLGTDRISVEAVAAKLSERLPVLIAPTIGFGYYPAFVEYAGSQHLAAATFEALAAESLDGFIRHGCRRVLLLNNGVSTEAPLKRAAEDIRTRRGVAVAIADLPGMGKAVEGLWTAGGGHADERETSLMLAVAPHLARRALFPAAADDRTGASGDTRWATAEKGAALLSALVDETAALMRASWPGFDPADSR